MDMKRPLEKNRILICCTGSVASMKIPVLIEALLSEQFPYQVNIELITTENAKAFYDPTALPVKLHTDEEEWKVNIANGICDNLLDECFTKTWEKMGDPVLHIELRKWADVMVISPLDANTMAKIANGICDNLLTCTVRAWDTEKPLLFAPAMNTHMWSNPITDKQRQMLAEFGYIEIPSIHKKLACGDIGIGAMAEVTTIVEKIREVLEKINT